MDSINIDNIFSKVQFPYSELERYIKYQNEFVTMKSENILGEKTTEINKLEEEFIAYKKSWKNDSIENIQESLKNKENNLSEIKLRYKKFNKYITQEDEISEAELQMEIYVLEQKIKVFDLEKRLTETVKTSEKNKIYDEIFALIEFIQQQEFKKHNELLRLWINPHPELDSFKIMQNNATLTLIFSALELYLKDLCQELNPTQTFSERLKIRKKNIKDCVDFLIKINIIDNNIEDSDCWQKINVIRELRNSITHNDNNIEGLRNNEQTKLILLKFKKIKGFHAFDFKDSFFTFNQEIPYRFQISSNEFLHEVLDIIKTFNNSIEKSIKKNTQKES